MQLCWLVQCNLYVSISFIKAKHTLHWKTGIELLTNTKYKEIVIFTLFPTEKDFVSDRINVIIPDVRGARALSIVHFHMCGSQFVIFEGFSVISTEIGGTRSSLSL